MTYPEREKLHVIGIGLKCRGSARYFAPEQWGQATMWRPKVNLQMILLYATEDGGAWFRLRHVAEFLALLLSSGRRTSLQPRVGASSAPADPVVERLACGYEAVRFCDFRDGLSVGRART